MSRTIDYNILVGNTTDIINTLEHDSMRSSGKMKMNSNQILALYKLLPIYQDKVAKQKPTPTKKEG
jgi:hypothetical protein